jgi:tetratricopeptide (TPR) repeat protein
MKKRLYLPLFFFLCGHCSSLFPDGLEKADRYFEATLFDQAEKSYRELIENNHHETKNIKRKLAKTYFLNQHFDQVVEVLETVGIEPSHSELTDLELESLFILGISYNRLKEYNKAVHPLLAFLAGSKRSLKHLNNKALFEAGYAHNHLDQFDKAKRFFEKIGQDDQNPLLFTLAQIYLAHIAITQTDGIEAQKRIQLLKQQREEMVPFAAAFLQGALFFHQNEWELAADEFEKAIPPDTIETYHWQEDTLHYLGWCYFNLGNEKQQPAYFERASTLFRSLCELSSTDPFKLSLAQALLKSRSDHNNSQALQELDLLFPPDHSYDDNEIKHHVLLLKAEAATSYSEKKRLYRQATNEFFQNASFFPKAWFLKGSSELEEGLKISENAKSQKEAKKYFDQSVASLQRAFDLLYPLDKKIAALALKQLATAHYHQNTREGFLKGLSVVSRLLNQYRETLFPLVNEPDEIYFLQGLLSSKLLDSNEKETFYTIAENSLLHCIESYPKGRCRQQSLHLLGTLYYQEKEYGRAQQIFLELAQQTPPSPYAGEAWYWAAQSTEMLCETPLKVQQLRKKAFEQFPDSPFADDAYFRYYSYQEYLKGSPEAIEHLKQLGTRFPLSPYKMNASYLIGLEALKDKRSLNGKEKHTRDPETAIQAFGDAAALFSQVKIPESKKEYFTLVRYRSLLEQALTLLQLAEFSRADLEFQKAEQILSGIYQEFEIPGHPISSSIKNSALNENIAEESAYHLVRCYLDQNKIEQAAQVLSHILDQYHQEKITRGYYLSRAWYQRGILAMNQKDPQFAVQCFQYAEDAAKGKVLSTDELLDLWIQKSLSFQQQEMPDEAMLILSKVINYDAISSERLKAMYLRAEIYEAQGRRELARRQLQATANKGGPWAIKAKEKLDKDYGNK